MTFDSDIPVAMDITTVAVNLPSASPTTKRFTLRNGGRFVNLNKDVADSHDNKTYTQVTLLCPHRPRLARPLRT